MIRRYLLLFALALLLPLLLMAVPGTTKRIYLTWDVAADHDTNVTYHVYSQTNIAAPVTAWQMATSIDYAVFKAVPKVELPPATDTAVFYVVTASNLVGESDFSVSVQVRRPSPAKNPKIGAF